ncbi:MAG: peroxiredoxin [Anaerolineaceae bacterium]
MLTVGSKAPEITATLDDGSEFVLSDALRTKNVVLYFYPRDFTTGCTKEACNFRDNYSAIAEHGALIVGVSTDSADRHASFRESHNLPFPLLADPGRTVVHAYKARGLFGLGTARVTYVIDRQSTIRAVIRHDLNISAHVPEVLAALAKIAAPA